MPRSRKGGVLLPTASNASNVVAVPIVAYDLANLDDRQYRGYVLFRKLVEGGKRALIFRSIDESTSAYSPSNETGVAYILTRTVANVRGIMVAAYACGCRDFLKNMRNGCKHTFCEQLRRGEATTFGDPPAREPRRTAQRRAPRDRRGVNGKAVRTNQRQARRDMPTRIPEMLDAIRRAEDRRVRDALALKPANSARETLLRGGQKTLDSTRAAALIVKVSHGVSSDAMHDRYRTIIERGLLPLREPPHPNSISAWMNDETLEPLLMRLFHETTLAFRAQETVGLVDSTKLSDAETASYRGSEYRGDDRPDARWMKTHVLSGLETNAVLAFDFSEDSVHDSLYYKTLVTTAMKTFPLQFVLADRAYLSEEILGWSQEEYGIKTVIPIKKRWNADTKSRYHEVCADSVDLYDNRHKSFDEMFRFRVKIEGVFSVIKRMFHGYVWSKGRRNKGADDGLSQAWRNETICKLIAYNLRCAVIQEIQTSFPMDFLHAGFFPAIPMELRAMQIAA